MNSEEDEFRRIEAEAKRRAQAAEDDDTQVYVKPWVGLTDEEIQKIWDVASGAIPGWSRHIAYARAIEAKLKEKNT